MPQRRAKTGVAPSRASWERVRQDFRRNAANAAVVRARARGRTWWKAASWIGWCRLQPLRTSICQR